MRGADVVCCAMREMEVPLCALRDADVMQSAIRDVTCGTRSFVVCDAHWTAPSASSALTCRMVLPVSSARLVSNTTISQI
eukprot:566220-Rhodomonas_salina.3